MWERDLPAELPGVPAAVPVYSKAGTAPVIVVDLDVSRGGRAAVDRDRDAVLGWLAGRGARAVVDRSPTGGVHVYIPLAEPVPFAEARTFAEALAARTPTMDSQPHAGITDGCIRPPGSPHKTGGHQELEMPLAAAYDVLKRPNPASAWEALCGDLAVEMAAARARRDAAGGPTVDPPAAEWLPRPGGPRPLPPGAHRIAATGDYDTTRYPSPSEARQAVLVAAAAAGWQLVDVVTRMETGRWPGLASLFARYRPHHRRTAAARDWRNALAHVRRKQATPAPVGDTVRKSSTSQPSTHAAAPAPPVSALDPHQQIRAWRNALASLEKTRYPGRVGLVRRLVLRALAEAAHKTGSTTVEMGVRSLAVATGQHHTTVAVHLCELRNELDPMIVRLQEARGTRGDLYELRIPDAAAGYARTAAWRPGKIHALRPAFRELGIVAAYAYEAIETATEPPHTLAIARATGIARSAVSTALDTLAGWGLIERRHGRWRLAPGGCLHTVAEALGVLEAVAGQIHRYRADRAAWRAWLSRHTPHPQVVRHDIQAAGWPPWPTDPVPEEPVTLLDLLYRELGAVPVYT